MASTLPTLGGGILADTSNTQNALVQRDASGNIAASQITGTALVSTGSLTIQGVSKTANYTVTANESVILCNAAGGAFAVTLPSASVSAWRQVWVMKTDATANVTINVPDSAVINGSATKVLTTQYQSVRLVCDGTNWYAF